MSSSGLSPEVIEEILDLVSRRQDAMVRNLLPNLHPAEIADLLDALDSESRTFVFDCLPATVRSDVLVELDERHRGELVEAMAPSELSEIVQELDSDDAADFVGELDEDVQEAVLDRLDAEDAAEIRLLLAYEDDTAGGIMATEFVSAGPDDTVDDAIERIREAAPDMAHIHHVYVKESDGSLMGVVSLRDLLLSRKGAPLRNVVAEVPLSVPPELDQEEVARLVRQYDVIEVPVVDTAGRMIGRITVDDIVDVIEEEAERDLARITGTGDESAVTDSVLHATGRRLPWLLVGLVGGLLAAIVLSRFELSLKALVSLAFFVPVINAMGGNVAIQSASIAVRGLAVGPGAYRAIGRRVAKEFFVSVLNGAVCGVVLGGVVYLWLDSSGLALLVCLSLFAVILIATTVGATIPILLDRLRIDPALAAGPFVTTANDVLGIVIYLTLASWVLPHVN